MADMRALQVKRWTSDQLAAAGLQGPTPADDHAHRWTLEPPAGSFSRGRCSLCDAVAWFVNSEPAPSFNSKGV